MLTLSSSSSRFIPPTESKTNSCSPAASIHSSSFSSLRPDVVFSSVFPEVQNVTYIMRVRIFRFLLASQLFTLKYILRGDDFRLFRLLRSLFFLSVEKVVHVVGHSRNRFSTFFCLEKYRNIFFAKSFFEEQNISLWIGKLDKSTRNRMNQK